MIKKISIKTPHASRAESAQEWVSSREGVKRFSMDVPLSFHEQLKIASAQFGQSMGSIVIEGTLAYINSKKQ